MNTADGAQKPRIPAFWGEVCQNGLWGRISALSNERPVYVYGVCANFGDDAMDYLIAARSDAQPPEGM
ncbi:MAG: AraC family transcriptional regulator, partial [Clostridiales bacterium]|nr:AraC family transcriptional regulator [Clostridiales bacterium]